MASKLILSSLLTLAVAQTSTITIPAIGYDESSFFASIISANSAATTISVACGPSPDCGLFPHHTIVYGPSTYNENMADPSSDFTATQDCIIAASSAICKETAGGSEANFPGSSTETYDATDIGSMVLTVTKGAEKLTASAQATAASTSMAKSSGSAVSSGVSASSSSGPGASRSTASVVQATSSNSASRSVSVSATGSATTGSATAAVSTGGANVLAMGGGAFGVAAGVLGWFL